MRGKRKWFALGTVAATLVIASRFIPFAEWIKEFSNWTESMGWVGYLLFISGYILGTLIFFPASLMTIAAGLGFGLFWGVVLASSGAVSGAAVAFLISRYFAREMIEKRIRCNKNFRRFDEAIERGDWKVVALLRLTPLMPFSITNYALGLSKIPLDRYIFASWIGMLPGTVLYVYLAHTGKALLIQDQERASSVEEYALMALGLIAMVVLMTFIMRLAKRKLGAETE